MARMIDHLFTGDALIKILQSLGIKPQDHFIVHTSLSALGYVPGGAHVLVDTLKHYIQDDGCILMPTHTADNTHPREWENPPIAPELINDFIDLHPGFDPHKTRAFHMGKLADAFWQSPDVGRSHHPIGSIAAYSKNPAIVEHYTMQGHDITDMFGLGSPMGSLYQNNGKILLLGVDYESCTALHLAEHLSNYAKNPKNYKKEGCKIKRNSNASEWVEFSMLAYETDDFNDIGLTFEQEFDVPEIHYHHAPCRSISMPDLVGFAVKWINKNRSTCIEIK